MKRTGLGCETPRQPLLNHLKSNRVFPHMGRARAVNTGRFPVARLRLVRELGSRDGGGQLGLWLKLLQPAAKFRVRPHPRYLTYVGSRTHLLPQRRRSLDTPASVSQGAGTGNQLHPSSNEW